jgi:hypothetical protein
MMCFQRETIRLGTYFSTETKDEESQWVKISKI